MNSVHDVLKHTMTVKNDKTLVDNRAVVQCSQLNSSIKITRHKSYKKDEAGPSA